MNKKHPPIHKNNLNSWNKGYDTSSSRYPLCNDPIDEERKLQQEEYKRRQKRDNSFLKLQSKQKNNKKLQLNALNPEENLERTWVWLTETFSYLFGSDSEAKPLDIHILRDIKNHYKNDKAQKHYPKDLIIKAALYRYMQQPEYLLCLQEGASRYDVRGDKARTVTKEEQEEALKLLKTMSRKSQHQLLQQLMPNLEEMEDKESYKSEREDLDKKP